MACDVARDLTAAGRMADMNGVLQIEMIDERCEMHGIDVPARRELWLVIGSWSDAHDWMICVDRSSPRFGVVADWNDTHPWSDARAEPERTWPDLVAFFGRTDLDEEEDEDHDGV